MSDWEDDDWANPKSNAPVVSTRSNANNANDWDDGQARNSSNHHERRERDHSSNRNSDGRSNYSQRDRNDGQDEEVAFAINKSNVGLVIGRGGSKIKELEQKFHVRLNIGMSDILFFFIAAIHSHPKLL